MASDVGTSINVIQLAIEVSAIVFAAGGLYVMVKGHAKKLETLEAEMKDVRENRVTKHDLEDMEKRIKDGMEAQANVIVGKVLLALGADRRLTPRE